MAFLLIFIFFVVVVFYFIPRWIPAISKRIVEAIKPESSEEISLRKELKELSVVLRETSVVNEFANYARTERKINKLTEELKQKGKSKSSAVLKAKVAINVFIHGIQVVVFLSLIYNWRYTPLIEVPPGWFWPIANLVAFPTGVPGAVSITIWILACRSMVHRLSTILAG